MKRRRRLGPKGQRYSPAWGAAQEADAYMWTAEPASRAAVLQVRTAARSLLLLHHKKVEEGPRYAP